LAQRHYPWNGGRRFAGLPNLAANVDTPNVQNACLAIEVAALKREPFLRP
jgi:hypothetical protein